MILVDPGLMYSKTGRTKNIIELYALKKSRNYSLKDEIITGLY